MWSRPLGPTHTPLLCPDSLQDAFTSLRSASCLLMAQNGARLASPREGRSCSPDGPCSACPPARPSGPLPKGGSEEALASGHGGSILPSPTGLRLVVRPLPQGPAHPPRAPPNPASFPSALVPTEDPPPVPLHALAPPSQPPPLPHPPGSSHFLPVSHGSRGSAAQGSWGRGDGLPGGLADRLLRKLCRGVGVSLPERLEDEPHPRAAGTCVLV